VDRLSESIAGETKMKKLPTLQIVEQSIADLADYASVPIAFEVKRILDVEVIDGGLGGFALRERPVETPYVKDYDAFDAVNDEGPTSWARRWDISNWGIIAAFVDGVRVGGCVLAYNTDGVNKLEGRTDIAVLWDVRVHPDCRRKGIGSELFQAAVTWARRRTCRMLKIETQNINVPACRFYARQGCVLGSVNRFAYDEFPEEVELIWMLAL
jgi:GNAT superfamily N-acetyltransferase